MSSGLKGILLTLTGGFLWGFSGVCGQYLFEQKGANARWIGGWRLFVAGVLLLIAAFVRYKRDALRVFEKRNIIPVLIFSYISLMGCQYTYFVAIDASNSATATVLQYISPAVVMVFVCIAGKRLPSLPQGVALLCAMTGVFVMVTGGNINTLHISSTALAAGLISGVCYAVYTVQSPSLSAICGLLPLLGWGNILGFIPLFIINRDYMFSYVPDWQGLLAFLGTAVIGVIFGFGIYVRGCQLAGPVTGSLCASIEPMASALISYLWLKTTFGITDIAGMLLIVGTVVILALDRGISERKNKENTLSEG